MATVGTSFQVGDIVSIKFTGINGEVTNAALADGTTINYLVAYTDNMGEDQERYFTADQIDPLA